MVQLSVVIPGRNCADTIGECVRSVRDACAGVPQHEVLYVDDRSTDASAELAARAGATVLRSTGEGAGAARNLGWRTARGALIWFVDSDCVAAADALTLLLPHLDAAEVGAVSGSYDNGSPGSRLAALIHEEIVERHRVMPAEVDFLASFSVVYRRSVLAQLDGFDERFLRGQDAELSFRTLQAGHRLRFERASRVAHHHERSLARYLRQQYHQGYWRAFLHTEHHGRIGGDSYSRLSDHLQPPVAMLTLALPATTLLFGAAAAATATGAAIAVLLALQLPMSARLARPHGVAFAANYALFSAVRAYWRGVGFSLGVMAKLLSGRRAACDRSR